MRQIGGAAEVLRLRVEDRGTAVSTGLGAPAGRKSVIAGFGATPHDESRYFETARLRRDGRPDRTFSRDGISDSRLPRPRRRSHRARLQGDGRIVVVGSSAVAS